MELDFSLHPGQLEIFQNKARFKIVAAGRRFGKSYLSAVTLLIEALKMENEYGYDLSDKVVYYVAQTFKQGKDIMWKLLKNLGQDVIQSPHENTAVLKLVNGREIHIKGSDRPDTLRGVGLSYVVLDEYATMKPEVWEEIIRPTLADVKGGALFIGTPAGKNHFYNLFIEAKKEPEEWSTFEYHSADNPFIDEKEIESAKKTLSVEAFKQEFEASFRSGGGVIFKEDYFNNLKEEPKDGDYYIAVDPAGFTQVDGRKALSRLKRLDEMAIAIVKVGDYGWYVKDILTGRWDTREASLQILRACQKFQPRAVGIEKGSLKNAIMPYLTDQMRRLQIYPNIVEVTHGNKKKEERITWALQGRLQHGRIGFADAPYHRKLIEQGLDFPNPLSHDDMLDALSYIDQVAVPCYIQDVMIDSWEPLDNDTGF